MTLGGPAPPKVTITKSKLAKASKPASKSTHKPAAKGKGAPRTTDAR